VRTTKPGCECNASLYRPDGGVFESTGLVGSWAGRLIAQHSARTIVNDECIDAEAEGLMDNLSQLANFGLTLVGFGLPIITIYLLYRLVRNTERPSSGSNPWPTAIELLDDRFARGEISEEEYRERKRILIEEDLDRRAQL
jgi:putative membrane protein